MAFELKTSINIEASPEKVWKVLTDFESYPDWNPFIKSIKGDVRVGNKIEAHIQSMKFKPTVLIYRDAQEFAWLGHLLFKGLFDGKHSFVLVDEGDGSTRFEHSESFTGILVPLFKQKLRGDIKPGFETMNLALKQRVEN